jgi:hypothetical protein
VSTTTAPDRATRYRRLRNYNLFNGVAHLGQVIAILALSNDLALPLLGSFLSDDPVAAISGVGRGEFPPVEQVGSVRVGLWVAVFLAFAAADHLLTALPLRGWYERKLDERANYARWIEYSISSSIMVVLIAMFVGIWDVGAVVGMFAANSAMIIFGLIMERRESVEDPDMSAFWWGTVFGLVPWLLLVYYVIQGGGTVPGFVYVILVVQFLLFWSFGMNMWLQYRQVGRWKDYIFGEYVYITLSLAAKTLLAWLVFANVLTAELRA